MKKRALCIGIALNCRDRGYGEALQDQYTDPRTQADVVGALASFGADLVEIEADRDFPARATELAGALDLVLNLAEGLPCCHSRHVTVPAVLDHLGVPWTGAPVEGHLLAANKAMTRRLLGESVHQPRWWRLGARPSILPPDLEYPVMVKPMREGYSVGIDQRSVAGSELELRDALRRLGERAREPFLVESFLDGVEYSAGLVGEVVMPAVSWDLQRLPGAPRVRGEDLKREDLTIPHADFVRDPETRISLATQAVTSHLALGLRDYSRSDLRARAGSPLPFFLETNSMPGLQDHQSVLPWAAGRAGVAYRDVIGSIIALAGRRLSPEQRNRVQIDGFESAYERLKGLAAQALTVRVGDRDYYLLDPPAESARPEVAEAIGAAAAAMSAGGSPRG